MISQNSFSPQQTLKIAKLIEQSKARQLERKNKRIPLLDMPDVVEWIQTNFYIPETGKGMGLYPSQIIPLREALSHNGNQFNYSTVCWSAVKKSAKSTLAAAVAMWYAMNQPWSSVKVIANDQKQAASRSYEAIVKAIQLNQEWRNTIKVTRYTITLPNHSVIEAIPQDPEGEAGASDDFVLYTEVWGWKHAKALKMWTESTLSPLKFGQSMRWAESYAGYVGSSPVLEQLYDRGVKEGELINADYEMYRNARMFCLWQTKAHLPWQTPEYYAQEASELIPPEFNRLHRNQWTSDIDTFIPLEWWNACQRSNIPPLAPGETIVVAMDAAVSGDSFGLLAVGRHPKHPTHVVVRYARRWLPPKGGKIDFQGTEHDPGPERELRRLCEQYNVVCVAYDPYQLEDMANRMGREGIAWMFAFTQGKQRLTADSDLRTIIMERRIHHSGEPELTEHIQNAAAKIDGEDSKIRIVKKAQSLKVDLAVCLSMGCERVLYLNL